MSTYNPQNPLIVQSDRTLLLEEGPSGDRLVLRSEDRALIAEVWNQRRARALFRDQISPLALEVPLLNRGRVKQVLLKIGWPVEDLAGYTQGEALTLHLRDTA